MLLLAGMLLGMRGIGLVGFSRCNDVGVTTKPVYRLYKGLLLPRQYFQPLTAVTP